MARKGDFQAQWRSAHASRAWLSPVNLLLATMLLGAAALMVFELSLLDGTLLPTDAYAQVIVEEDGNVYPEHVLTSAWATPVPRSDRLHLALLHEACMAYNDSVITSAYAKGGKVTPESVGQGIINRDDPELFEKIRQCTDVDIFLPVGIRSHGYCEDAVGYAKYLEARILPMWAIETTYTDKTTGKQYSYHELCPKAPMIFLNHYWDGVPDRPDWPADKPKYLMPNIEMFELNEKHYWSVDAVLCKTAICARRVRAWYEQEGNPKHAVVFYTRHTTSDVATLARERLGDAAVQPKNFADVRFVHAVGTSSQKGTRHVLECFVSRDDLPPLDLYIKQDVFEFLVREQELRNKAAALKHRIVVHSERVPANEFGKLTAENAFFICTSFQEGYGHYINQARATGALIITTDLPPMNELLTPESGVMVPVTRRAYQNQLLGGNANTKLGLKGVQGMTASIHSDNICAAIDRVMAMTTDQRVAMAARAKVQYDIDTNFFAAKMKEVRTFARGPRGLFRVPAI